jgi:hypothetical protein
VVRGEAVERDKKFTPSEDEGSPVSPASFIQSCEQSIFGNLSEFMKSTYIRFPLHGWLGNVFVYLKYYYTILLLFSNSAE